MSEKTVLITGAARRLGSAIVHQQHARGMNIVLHYHRSAGPAQALARELNRERDASVLAVAADLRDPASYAALIEATAAFRGRLDALINNASAFFPTPLQELSARQWDELVDVNMKAPVFLAQHAAALLRESGGCIVNITDIHAARPLRHHPVYSATKAGLEMLTRALAKELGPEVRVNAIAPGAILWPRDMDADTKQTILSRTVLKHQGNPGDIARAVQFLILEADYMTGQVLVIDGGRTLFS